MNRRLIVLTALVAAVAGSLSAAPVQSPQRRVIEITAERFEFWPSDITIAEGEAVELRITSEDTMHGFRIIGAGVNVTVPKRGKGPAVIPFDGTTPGRYTFDCTQMCGAGHNFMRGTLTVRPVGSAR